MPIAAVELCPAGAPEVSPGFYPGLPAKSGGAMLPTLSVEVNALVNRAAGPISSALPGRHAFGGRYPRVKTLG